jgi:hypothetical protein
VGKRKWSPHLRPEDSVKRDPALTTPTAPSHFLMEAVLPLPPVP